MPATYLFDLPSVAGARNAARLLPSQYGPKISEAAFEGDVQGFINSAADQVESELLQAAKPHVWPLADGALESAYPEYSADQRTRFTSRQETNAAEVVRLWAAATIIRESIQINEAYEKRAESLESRGQKILDVLIGDAEFVSEAATDAASASGDGAQSILLNRVDAYSPGGRCAEHTPC